MDADEQAVIHHTDAAQELCIASQLLCQQCPLLRAELEQLAPVDPVEVFEHSSRICSGFFLGVFPPNCAPLEIIRLVDIPVGREQIVHNDKVDLATMRQLDTVQTVKA